MKHFLLSATDNYQNDAYILKLDIKSYFMNMQHKIIYEKINTILSKKFNPKVIDFETLDYLLKQTIFINVKNNCRIKGKKSEWKSLPHDKSLFNKPDGIGLPIGNLTSQVFGNIYLNKIDHYIKNELGIKYYGRYVDDMIFVHPRKEKLLSVINPINNKLKEIGMKIHPQKIYLQHYDKGVLFIGQYIKPYRSYISNRTKHNFYRLINETNTEIHKTEAIPWETMKDIQSRLNSYLGILQHTNSFRLKRKALQKLNHQRFLQFFSFTPDMSKVIINKDFWLWHYSQTYLFTNKATTYY